MYRSKFDSLGRGLHKTRGSALKLRCTETSLCTTKPKKKNQTLKLKPGKHMQQALKICGSPDWTFVKTPKWVKRK